MSLTIDIVYHGDSLPLEKIVNGDWIDLRASEDVELRMLESYKIPLGVSMRLPEGYEAHILPRSSTFDKWGIILANGEGIIDNSYSGTNDVWMFNAICLKPHTKIHKGDRICQFRLFKKMPDDISFNPVDKLDDKNRGGFGSTGTR